MVKLRHLGRDSLEGRTRISGRLNYVDAFIICANLPKYTIPSYDAFEGYKYQIGRV